MYRSASIIGDIKVRQNKHRGARYIFNILNQIENLMDTKPNTPQMLKKIHTI